MEVAYWAQNVRDDDGVVLGGVGVVLELCSCDVAQTCVVQHERQLQRLQPQDYGAAVSPGVVEEWHDVAGHVMEPHGARRPPQGATAANCIPECVAYCMTELGHCMGEWTRLVGWCTQAGELSCIRSWDVCPCTQE